MLGDRGLGGSRDMRREGGREEQRRDVHLMPTQVRVGGQCRRLGGGDN